MDKTTDPLNNILLAFPCPIAWESMPGDERERFCRSCSNNVYNISDMTEIEANAFLQDKVENTNVCIRFYKRPDGTIKTDNCPRHLRPLRNFAVKVQTLAFLALTITLTLAQSVWSKESLSKLFEKNVFELKGPDRSNLLGRPAPSAIRNATYSVIIEAREEASPELFKKFSSEENEQKIILSTLDELADFYETQKLFACQLNVCLLKKLVKEKMPGAKTSFDCNEFETLRDKAQTRLLDEIDEFSAKGNFEKCRYKVHQFHQISVASPCPSYKPTNLPKGVRIWPEFHGNEMIVRSSNLDRIINSLNKLKSQGGFIDDLLVIETTKKLGTSNKSQQHDILTNAEHEWSVYMQAHKSPTILVVAELVEKKLPSKLSKLAVMKYKVVTDPYKKLKRNTFELTFNEDTAIGDALVVGKKYIMYLEDEPQEKNFSLSGPRAGICEFDPKIWENLRHEAIYYQKCLRKAIDDLKSPMNSFRNPMGR